MRARARDSGSKSEFGRNYPLRTAKGSRLRGRSYRSRSIFGPRGNVDAITRNAILSRIVRASLVGVNEGTTLTGPYVNVKTPELRPAAPKKISRVNMKQSQSHACMYLQEKDCGDVRNWKMGFYLSRARATSCHATRRQNFSATFSFVSYSRTAAVSRTRISAPRKLGKFAPSTKRRLPALPIATAARSYTVEIELYRLFGATVVTIGN